MSIYAVGDVQGCHDELLALLEKIQFDPADDILWFCGDLVNRGNKSLETLRFVKSLGDRAISVLGNHDLHLVAIANGVRKPGKHDTLQAILEARDRDELIDWLRSRPLLHHDATNGFTLLHAGLPPQWDLGLALRCAREAETLLRSDDYMDFIQYMYGNEPDMWDDQLTGHDRIRFIVNCFTRMRYCDADGRLDLKSNGPPGSQPEGLRPWFKLQSRQSRNMRIIFGHWSTLGDTDVKGIYPLDTGCLWGGRLTTLRLGDEPEYIRLDCPGQRRPG